jgi:hypothetical protein
MSTQLGYVFDATQVAPSQPIEAVPAGWYPLAITEGEIHPSDGGTGQRLAIEMTIQEGPMKGRKAFDNLNIRHSNPKAQEIATQLLSAICHAVGVYQIADISQLFNRPFQGKLDIEAARTVDSDGNPTELPAGSPNTKTYDAKNRLKAAKALVAGATVASAAPAAPAANVPAWAAKPAATPPPPAPAPAAPAPAAPAPTAPAAAAAPKKPGRPPKPAAAPAPKPERLFYVGVDGPEFADAIAESKLSELFSKGLPADTPICLDGENAYKSALDYGVAMTVSAPTAPAKPAPAPVAPPAAPASPAANTPPWAR